MKKKKAVMMKLLQCNVEMKVTFTYKGEAVELEVLRSPCSKSEFFLWITTNKGQYNEMSFPRVRVSRLGVKASRYCLGKDIHIFIPYSKMLTMQEENQEDLF